VARPGMTAARSVRNTMLFSPTCRMTVAPWFRGGCFVFAVNLLERKQTLFVDPIASLREAVATTRAGIIPSQQTHSSCCQIICMRSGPCRRGIAIFLTRWRLIKSRFARVLPTRDRLRRNPALLATRQAYCLRPVGRVERSRNAPSC